MMTPDVVWLESCLDLSESFRRTPVTSEVDRTWPDATDVERAGMVGSVLRRGPFAASNGSADIVSGLEMAQAQR